MLIFAQIDDKSLQFLFIGDFFFTLSSEKNSQCIEFFESKSQSML